MSEMLERVARAAHDAQWEEPFPAEGSIAYAVAMQVARAAIEAMREPTVSMLDAAKNAEYKKLAKPGTGMITTNYMTIRTHLQAMIDEALK